MPVQHETTTQLTLNALLDDTPLLDNIVTPNDGEAYEQFLMDWSESKFFVLDLETANTKMGNGLDPYHGEPRLYQIGLQDNRVLIYDAYHDNCKLFKRILKQCCENPDNIMVGHNIYFDLMFLKQQFDINARGIRCTRIMATIRWCGMSKYYRFSLAAVYERLTGKAMSKEQQTSNWNDLQLSNTQLNYAAMDITNTFTVFLKLCKELKAFDSMPDLHGNNCEYKLTDIVKIECECLGAFVSMSFNGIPVDMELCQQMIDKYDSTMSDLFKDVGLKLGLKYSANPAKLAAAVWHEYGIWLIAEDDKKLDEADSEETITAHQLKMFDVTLPDIPKGFKISTTSGNLFEYYTETGEEALLVISLTRSLKKHADTLKNILKSAKRYGGVCRSRYTSLGSTGTGRSTSGSDRIATTELLNLQNLPNPINHELVEKYDLPPIRSVLRVNDDRFLSINDYAGSHLNLAIRLSGDQALASTKTLSDPHSLFTSSVMQAFGKGEKYTQKYCADNRKTDPEVKEFRSRSKTTFFSSFNGAGAKLIQAAFQKQYQQLELDDCKALSQGFKDTFATYVQWQRSITKAISKRIIDIPVRLKNGGKFTAYFGQARLPDGRLVNLQAFKNRFYDPKKKWSQEYTVRLPDCTSAHLLN